MWGRRVHIENNVFEIKAFIYLLPRRGTALLRLRTLCSVPIIDAFIGQLSSGWDRDLESVVGCRLDSTYWLTVDVTLFTGRYNSALGGRGGCVQCRRKVSHLRWQSGRVQLRG